MRATTYTYNEFVEMCDTHPGWSLWLEDGIPDGANVVVITNVEDKILNLYHDAMEPEDAIFTRDLSFVSEVINKAYDEGYQDGFIAGSNE